MKIIPRKEAIDLGLTMYYTGKPCKYGHTAERWVANKTCVTCHASYSSTYRKKHPEKISMYGKRYATEHPDKIQDRNASNYARRKDDPIFKTENRLRASEYKKKNRDRYNSHNHKRRAQIKEGESAEVVAKWIKAQPKVCYWCHQKCKKDYQIDHYVPLSKGGLHEINNLRISCPQCNMTKNAKDPYNFAHSKGRLF